MRKIAVVAILAVVLLSWGMAFAFQNEPDGFRGLKWGDPPTEDMEYLKEGVKGCKLYTRTNDKMQLGNAKLTYILYEFYENRLWFVGLSFQGKENYDLLQTFCEGKFGKETKKTLLQDSNFWEGPETVVGLIWNSSAKDGGLGFFSTVIKMGKDKAEKKREVIQQEKKDYEAKIKAYAKKKWPDDYEMQVYEYNNQMKALQQIRNLSSTADYNESILLKAIAKWGEDYEMVIYEYNNQLEAYKKMR